MIDDSDAPATLRAAAGRLDDLHRPAHEAPTTTDATGAGDPFDPMEHAARFEALHEALVAVLAEVEHADRART